MCNYCKETGYIEVRYPEMCLHCAATKEQVKNRNWQDCEECEGRGCLTRILKTRCPYCLIHKKKKMGKKPPQANLANLTNH